MVSISSSLLVANRNLLDLTGKISLYSLISKRICNLFTPILFPVMKPVALHSAGIPGAIDREELIAGGRRLEYLTIAWNAFEAAVALISGILAGSVALVGFGLDSVIETVSAVILLWRLRVDHDVGNREQAERSARRAVGVCFLLLAVYVAAESIRALWAKAHPERTVAGILIAVAAVIVMPLLGRAKRRIAAQFNSGALRSDSRQADFCAYLSAVLLMGLLLHALLGWWWADPVAALVMVPIIAREGVQGVRGEHCGCGHE
jgi:divalent metal cation (Fe/Co/Zn/Cd) transporter